MKKLLSIIALLITSLHSFAQNNGVEMATGLRSSGKIYVVVIVIVVIFLGLLAYIFSIDRRIKRLEKKD